MGLKVFRAYTYSTAAWLSLQSVPLIAGPSMIVAMLQDESRPATRKLLSPFLALEKEALQAVLTSHVLKQLKSILPAAQVLVF